MRSLVLVSLLLLLALAGLGVALLVDTRDAGVIAGDGEKQPGAGSSISGIDAAEGESGGENATSANKRVPLAGLTEAEVEADAAAKAPPRVHGRVLAPEGTPLAGARVFASVGEQWGMIPLDLEPEAIPRGWPEIVQTTSDADGGFSFEKLKPGTLRILVRAGGCEPLRNDRLKLPPGYKLHELGDFTLAHGVLLTGKVVDRARHGIVGARILQVLEAGASSQGISAPGRGLPLGESGAEGAFKVDELAAGPWHLLFDAPGYSVGEEQGRTERAGETQNNLYVLLESGTDCCGRVIPDPDSPAARNLRVVARLAEDREGQPGGGADAGPTPPRLLRMRSAVPDAEGNFCVSGLERARRYRFTLWDEGPDGKPRRVPGVDALTSWAGERGLAFRLKPGAELDLRVVDGSTGAPIEELCVWAGIGRERLLRDEKNQARRKFPDGRVRCTELQPQTPARPAILRVRASGFKEYENKNVQLKSGAPTDLGEIRLERAAQVKVLVLDARDDKPVENARVLCGLQEKGDPADYLGGPDEQEFWGDLNWQFARSAKDGTASFSSYPGKAVALRADAKGFLDSDTQKQLLPLEGDASVVLRLKHGGSVHVRVGDGQAHPVRNVGVAHRLPSAGTRGDDDWQAEQAEQTSDAQGEAHFQALVPGLHAFRIHDQLGQIWRQAGSGSASTGWVQVTVTEGSEETIDLVAPPRGAIEGLVREGGRPLEGASLRLVEMREGEDAGERGWMGPNDPLSTVTDPLGHFRYEGLRVGNYTLVIQHPSRRMAARFPIEVRAQERSQDFNLDVTGIEGRVTDIAGHPLAGLEVWAYVPDQGGYEDQSYQMVLREDDRGSSRVNYEQTGRRNTRTDAQGRYELRGLVPNLPLRLHVEGNSVETFDSQPLTLAPDELRHGLDFALRMAGTIAVQLEGGDSNQGSWYEVRALLVREGKEELRSSTWIGPWNRHDEMHSLSPGHYKLVCTRQGGPPGGEPAVQELDLHESETLEARFQAR